MESMIAFFFPSGYFFESFSEISSQFSHVRFSSETNVSFFNFEFSTFFLYKNCEFMSSTNPQVLIIFWIAIEIFSLPEGSKTRIPEFEIKTIKFFPLRSTKQISSIKKIFEKIYFVTFFLS